MRVREWARIGLAIVAWLFVGCLFVQIFLAGLGVFDGPGAFITHREFGYTFGWLTIVLLVLGLLGGVPRRLVGLTALTIVLFTLQSVLIALREDYPQVAALHPVNGVALLLVAIAIARQAWADRPAIREPAASRSSAIDPRVPS